MALLLGLASLGSGLRAWPVRGRPAERAASRAERQSMAFHDMAGAACRALTARKDGPSLYDVCDPLLLNGGARDQHLAQFYRTALGQPGLRPLLRRTGLTELNDSLPARRVAQGPGPGARRRHAELGCDRPAGGGIAWLRRAAASHAQPSARQAAAPKLPDTRARHPRLRRASITLATARTASSRPMPPST